MSEKMSREQAAGVLLRRKKSLVKIITMTTDFDPSGDAFDQRVSEEMNAIMVAVNALRSPALDWVRTADRMPTEADADEKGFVIGWSINGEFGPNAEFVERIEIREFPNDYPYWFPLLKAPQENA